jgi:hypothetical protein
MKNPYLDSITIFYPAGRLVILEALQSWGHAAGGAVALTAGGVDAVHALAPAPGIIRNIER